MLSFFFLQRLSVLRMPQNEAKLHRLESQEVQKLREKVQKVITNSIFFFYKYKIFFTHFEVCFVIKTIKKFEFNFDYLLHRTKR